MIVHHAGIVDQRFKDRVGSELLVGSIYDPNQVEIERLREVSRDAGHSLLTWLDGHLSTVKG